MAASSGGKITINGEAAASGKAYVGKLKNGLTNFTVKVIAKDGTTEKPAVAGTRLVGFRADSPEVVLVRKAFKDIEVVEDARVDHSVDLVIGTEFAGWSEQPDLRVPVPGGEVCLPAMDAPTVTE